MVVNGLFVLFVLAGVAKAEMVDAAENQMNGPDVKIRSVTDESLLNVSLAKTSFWRD